MSTGKMVMCFAVGEGSAGPFFSTNYIRMMFVKFQVRWDKWGWRWTEEIVLIWEIDLRLSPAARLSLQIVLFKMWHKAIELSGLKHDVVTKTGYRIWEEGKRVGYKARV